MIPLKYRSAKNKNQSRNFEDPIEFLKTFYGNIFKDADKKFRKEKRSQYEKQNEKIK